MGAPDSRQRKGLPLPPDFVPRLTRSAAISGVISTFGYRFPLRSHPSLAVRLGEVRKDVNPFWRLHAQAQKDLISGRRVFTDITDADFSAALGQKGVDMRIGLDIASITLKRQAQIIVLVSGDSDFVPAAKFARREGVQFILDPLWQGISPDLSEHIDRLTSGFPRPGAGGA